MFSSASEVFINALCRVVTTYKIVVFKFQFIHGVSSCDPFLPLSYRKNVPAATPEGENLLSRDRNLFPEVENQVSGLRPQGAHRMRPLQDVVNLRLTALCIADRLSCLYRSRDLAHHSFFPGSQIKGSNANRNNIKTDNISHTSGTGSPALVPSLASYCFMVTSGIKSGGETKFRPRQSFSRV